jgi:beta-glucosidase
MGGLALADVLLGDHSPSGKLPVSFPRHGGQMPFYYAHRRSSHPHHGAGRYLCRHLDVPFGPLFGFGHGLSYANFTYGPVTLSDRSFARGGSLEVSVEVTNIGGRAGREVVQLYLRDDFCPVVRPKFELKGFQVLDLPPGQSAVARFTLAEEHLVYWGCGHAWVVDPGTFTVFVGPDQTRLQSASFEFR